MMTKTNTKKSSTMARVALGATAALALAGHANAGTFAAASRGIVMNVQEDPCAYLAFDDATGALVANGATTGATTGLAVSGNANAEDGFDDCDVVAGYYIKVAATGANDGTGLVIQKAPAGWYAPGGAALHGGTVLNVAASALVVGTHGGNAVVKYCHTTFGTNAAAASMTSAGGTDITGCVTKPGYYISVTHTGGNVDATTAATVSGKYHPGGDQLQGGTAAGPSTCEYAGTSPALASSVTQCVPDCSTTNPSTNAVAAGGTCVCAANYYGTPKDLNNVQVAAASYGCTACTTTFPKVLAAGMISAQGSSVKAGCVTKAGYSLKTAGADAAREIQLTTKNYYNVGGVVIATETVASGIANTDATCKFVSTSVTTTGAANYAACTPDCDLTVTTTNAMASHGYCICKAGYQGTPVDATGSDTSHAVGGCVACPTGWSSVAGGNCYKDVTVTSTTTTNNSPAAATPGAALAASGASSVSVFAAAAAIAAAQLVL